jgi:hypothetical protein
MLVARLFMTAIVKELRRHPHAAAEKATEAKVDERKRREALARNTYA